MMKYTKDLKRTFFIIISALLYSLSMKIFVDAGNLFPGGFSGITLLITRTLQMYFNLHIPFGILYLLLHIIPTIMVYKYIGHRFTVYSILQFSLVSLFTSILPEFSITSDTLLIAIFGGILSGTAISIALKQNASSGGTDFIAIYFANKYNVSTWNYIMLFNCGVLIIAGFMFGWYIALYSIIYQFCSTQIVNTLHQRYKLETLMIVTDKDQEVSDAVFASCNHGLTRFNGVGQYTKQPRSVLMLTISSYQTSEVIHAITAADPQVFINVLKTEKVIGNYKQSPME